MKDKILFVWNGIKWVLFIAALLGAYQYLGGFHFTRGHELAEVHFIQTIDDANCTLLMNGDTNVLIDTGEEQDYDAIAAFLREKQVSDIQYLILTHPDADHIGGAMGIVENFTVRTVIQTYYIKENSRLSALNSRLEELNIPVIYPNNTRRFRAGDMNILVYPPLERNYKKSNNYSLAVLVRHGQVNMAFTGDAERKRTEELLMIHWPKVDLYQVAHHGRSNPLSEALLEALSPVYAVSGSRDSDEIIKSACERLHTQLFYSVGNTTSFVSDGISLKRL